MHYLNAIQRLPGNTASEKLSWIGRLASNHQEAIQKLDQLSPELLPILKVEAAVKNKVYKDITSALKSDDSTIVTRALKASWYFDGSHTIVDVAYFDEHIFPYVSVRTRIRIVKTCARRIKNPDFAQQMFLAVASAYNVRTALPLIVVCSDKFIKKTIKKEKFLLPVRILQKIFLKSLDLGVFLLKSFICDYDVYSPRCRNYTENDQYNIVDKYASFMPILIKNRPMDFLELIKLFNFCPCKRYYVMSNKCAKKFVRETPDVLADEPRIYLSMLPRKITQNVKQMEKLLPYLMKNFHLNEFFLYKYLEIFPENKKFLLLKTYKERYGELLNDLEHMTPELLRLLPVKQQKQVARKMINIIPAHNAMNFQKAWICYFPAKTAISVIKIRISRASKSKDKVGYLLQMLYTCKINKDDDALSNTLKYIKNNYKRNQILKKVMEYLHEVCDIAYLSERNSITIFDIVQLLYTKYGYVNKSVIKKMMHFRLIHNMPITDLIDMFLKSNTLFIKFNMFTDYPQHERQCLLAFIDNIQKKYSTNWQQEEQQEADKKQENRADEELENEETDEERENEETDEERENEETDEERENEETDEERENEETDEERENEETDEEQESEERKEINKLLDNAAKQTNKYYTKHEFERKEQGENFLLEEEEEEEEEEQEINETQEGMKKNITVCKLVLALYDFNKRCETSNITLERITIKDYPWLMDAICAIMHLKTDFFSRKKARYVLQRQEPELYRSWFPSNTSKNIEDVTSGAALFLLKRDSQSILDNWQEYLIDCQKNYQRKHVQRFVRAARWYKDLPIKFAERCVDNLVETGINESFSALVILSLLLRGNSLAEMINPLLLKTVLDNYEFVRILDYSMRFSNPPVPLKLAAKLYDKGYPSITLMTLVSISRRVPFRKVMLFTRQLRSMHVSVRKNLIKLMSSIASLCDFKVFLKKLCMTEKQSSVRELLFFTIQKLFRTRPQSQIWSLCSKNMSALTLEDEALLRNITMEPYRVSEKYRMEYFDHWLETIENLSKQGVSVQYIMQHVKVYLVYFNMYDHLYDHELEDVLRYCLFHRHIGISEATRSYAIYPLLLLTFKKNLTKCLEIINIFHDLVPKYWNIRHSDNLRFYPINNGLHKFFVEFISKYIKIHKNVYFNSQITDSMLKIFSSVLSPVQEPQSYLLLIYTKTFQDCDQMNAVSFGTKLGHIISELVNIFSEHLVTFMAKILMLFLNCIHANKNCPNVIDNTLQGLMHVDNIYSRYMTAVMLDMYSFGNNSLIEKFEKHFLLCRSSTALLYHYLNRTSFNHAY